MDTASRRTSSNWIIATIVFTNFIDYLLLTTIVPVIPKYLLEEDEKQAEADLLNTSNNTWTGVFNNGTDIVALLNLTMLHNHTAWLQADEQDEEVNHLPLLRPVIENSRVAWLLSTKALVQMLAIPVVGYLSNRVRYKLLLMFGTSIFLISSSMYAVSETYGPLLVARAAQGVGSAATMVSGMSMLAAYYQDDTERSRAMGKAMGGTGMGILVGYPYGGLLYAATGKLLPFLGIAIFCLIAIVMQSSIIEKSHSDNPAEVMLVSTSMPRLMRDPYIMLCVGAITVTTMSISVIEPTVPLWVMETMDAEDWQLGVIFIPDSIGYLVGANGFAVIAKTYGRWLFSCVSMLLVGVGLAVIPFCTEMSHLLLPHLGIGFGVGVTDAALMPLVALIVDQHHTSTYGTAYAVVQLAVSMGYFLGPAMAGAVIRNIGFPWFIWSMALLNILGAPLCVFLRTPPAAKETQCILEDMEDIHRRKSSSYSTLD